MFLFYLLHFSFNFASVFQYKFRTAQCFFLYYSFYLSSILLSWFASFHHCSYYLSVVSFNLLHSCLRLSLARSPDPLRQSSHCLIWIWSKRVLRFIPSPSKSSSRYSHLQQCVYSTRRQALQNGTNSSRKMGHRTKKWNIFTTVLNQKFLSSIVNEALLDNIFLQYFKLTDITNSFYNLNFFIFSHYYYLNAMCIFNSLQIQTSYEELSFFYK